MPTTPDRGAGTRCEIKRSTEREERRITYIQGPGFHEGLGRVVSSGVLRGKQPTSRLSKATLSIRLCAVLKSTAALRPSRPHFFWYPQTRARSRCEPIGNEAISAGL